jgi:hypothetical protein
MLLFVLEKMVEALTRRGYAMVIITNGDFLPSSWSTLELMMMNIKFLVVVTLVEEMMESVGKLAMITAAMVYCWNHIEGDSYWAPLMACFVVSYWIASMFVQVLNVPINTLFITLLHDDSAHGGHDRYLPKKIRKYIRAASGHSGKTDFKLQDKIKLRHPWCRLKLGVNGQHSFHNLSEQSFEVMGMPSQLGGKLMVLRHADGRMLRYNPAHNHDRPPEYMFVKDDQGSGCGSQCYGSCSTRRSNASCH